MRKIIFFLLAIIALSSCSKVESTVPDEELIKYIKRWNSDFSSISGNLSYESKALKSSIEDPIIQKIIEEEFKSFNYGSSDYMEQLVLWAYNQMSHTQKQEAYRNFIRKEPWNGTHKILLPYEMERLGKKQNTYMGKCSSLAHFIIALLRESGLDKADYLLLAMADHTLAIFRYNDSYYMVDNNAIYSMSDKMKKASPGLVGIYHEDMSTAAPIKLTQAFYEAKDSKPLFQRLTELNQVPEEDIYLNDFDENVRKYLEHKMDVDKFELYIQASIEEPNVNQLAKELIDLEDIFDWADKNIVLEPMGDTVQLADESIAFQSGTVLDRAVLIKSILTIQERQCQIHHEKDNVYLEIDGQRYDMKNFIKS